MTQHRDDPLSVMVDPMSGPAIYVWIQLQWTMANEGARFKSDIFVDLRTAYADELRAQAARVGCPGRVPVVTNSATLAKFNEVATEHAESIIRTYNWDLAHAAIKIRRDVPRANKVTYRARLRTWYARRSRWKDPQITMMTDRTARALAFADFYDHNGALGLAELVPKTAVCPICQGWINRGQVPIKIASAYPPPYHVNCVPPDGEVLTPDGETPISEVAAGDLVMTASGSQQVEKVFQRQTQEKLYRISVAGRVLSLTGDHPVKTMHGWIPARELIVGDQVQVVGNESGPDDKVGIV